MARDRFERETVDAEGVSPLARPSQPPDVAPSASPSLAASESAHRLPDEPGFAGDIGTADSRPATDDELTDHPRARRAGGRRPVLLALVAVLAIAVCLPVGWFARGVVRDTLAAGRGAATPTEAVIEYFAAGPLGSFGHDDVRFDRVLCEETRGALRAQAEQMARDVDRAATNHRMNFLAAEPGDDQVTVDGSTATVATQVRLTFSFRERQGGGANFLESERHPWTFRLRNDRGWRICQVDAPVICGTVLNCDAVPTPSVRPSRSRTGASGARS